VTLLRFKKYCSRPVNVLGDQIKNLMWSLEEYTKVWFYTSISDLVTSTYWYVTCIPGKPACLVVAGETDLRSVNPYKAGQNSVIQALSKSFHDRGHKVESVDILWDVTKSAIFWSDHHSKMIRKTYLYNVSSTVNGMQSRRVQRDDSNIVVSAVESEC
jgi:hypothetical protein